MTKTIWVSFDLGIRGDFEGMYKFLDAHSAKECGNNLAVLKYDAKSDVLQEVTKDLRKAIRRDKRTRVYVIHLDEKGKAKGRFVIGARKPPAWAGYSPSHTDEEDADE